ncbi:ROK family protein [Streptomyces sp. NPDC015220]|uniref:ROK family protein n=1 Tax=Streptomyces sp. NPDC015220 TaxID=3364947 RepID=UPI00370111F0
MTAVPVPGAEAVIGLDLGGTKIAAALVGPDGTVLRRHTRPTPARAGARAVVDALADAAREVDDGAWAIGVAAAGVVDPRTGIVTSATDSIAGWAGTPLAAGLYGRTGLPVACDNDVRATAATELAALPDPHGSLVYVAVGTGVGGAVAVDGRMLHGSAGIAGHLGHVPSPEAGDLPCTCGGSGHLEAIASGPAITALYRRLSGQPAERLQDVAERAAAGDTAARQAVATGARAAGRVAGGLANALGPHRVVVGGGVPHIGEPYWTALTDAFRAELMAPLRHLRPRHPRLGADAAVQGAALLTRTAPLHRSTAPPRDPTVSPHPSTAFTDASGGAP